MNTRQLKRQLFFITASTFVTWTGQRVSFVALPLVALSHTGEVWATGLVGGFAGIPLVLSPWWGRPFRDKLRSFPALAILLLIQALGVAIVPLSAAAGGVTIAALCFSGLVTGAATALVMPAQRSLTADIADEFPKDTEHEPTSIAAKSLAWQDLAQRLSMIFAPPLGALLVVRWGEVPVLWWQAAALIVSACTLGAVWLVPTLRTGRVKTEERTSAAQTPRRSAPKIRRLLLDYPELGVAIGLAGVGGLMWFGFVLGLSVIGAELQKPGEFLAAGMGGYGATTIIASLSAPMLVTRVPRIPIILLTWALLGASFMAMPLGLPSLLVIGIISGAGGALLPIGMACMNSLISERTQGAERHAAFTAQTMAYSGGTALGLLFGGLVIDILGAVNSLFITGIVQLIASVAGAGILYTLRYRNHKSHLRGSRAIAEVG